MFDIEQFKTNEDEAVRQKMWDDFLASNPSPTTLHHTFLVLLRHKNKNAFVYVHKFLDQLFKADISADMCRSLIIAVEHDDACLDPSYPENPWWLHRFGHKMLAQDELSKELLLWLITGGPKGCHEGAYERLLFLASQAEKQSFLTEEETVDVVAALVFQGVDDMEKSIMTKLGPLSTDIHINRALVRILRVGGFIGAIAEKGLLLNKK